MRERKRKWRKNRDRHRNRQRQKEQTEKEKERVEQTEAEMEQGERTRGVGAGMSWGKSGHLGAPGVKSQGGRLWKGQPPDCGVSESGKGLRGSEICDQGGVTLGSEIGGQTW